MRRFLRIPALFAALCGMAAQEVQARYGWGGMPEGGSKHVVIDKSRQMLRAYEGNQVVMETHISTGRRGRETPNGRFRAQSKALMHYSRLYDNAPMPYSVQIAGTYFIHGFSSVPNYPASHGCIRLPVDSARQFYQWVDSGTPVDIVGKWGS